MSYYVNQYNQLSLGYLQLVFFLRVRRVFISGSREWTEKGRPDRFLSQ